jgi:hypothetical protein
VRRFIGQQTSPYCHHWVADQNIVSQKRKRVEIDLSVFIGALLRTSQRGTATGFGYAKLPASRRSVSANNSLSFGADSIAQVRLIEFQEDRELMMNSVAVNNRCSRNS